MADAAVRGESVGLATRVRRYVSDVNAEMKRVTWPDAGQIRQLSIGVVVLSLAIGGLIAIMDAILNGLLISWIPSLFR